MLIRSFFTFFTILSLISLAACGGSQSPPEEGSPQSVKAAGLGCFKDGDVSCAEENYCSLAQDNEAGLRCCVATFLKVYFSENTVALGTSLGYEPLGLNELRNMSKEEILRAKALPFAEIFFTSKEEGVEYKKMLASWGLALVDDNASTSELNGRLKKLGAGLETTLKCLDNQLSGFQDDELNPEIFTTEKGVPVAKRDLLFVKFFLGASSYVLQGLTQYEWGFEQFPSLPPSDGFLQDLNGKKGAGDIRFADLSEAGAGKIAGKFKLLVQSLDALKAFSQLKDHPSRIDSFLNWRFSKEDQEWASGVLGSLYQSIKKAQWYEIPGEDWLINFFSFAKVKTIPSGERVPTEWVVLQRDEEGEIEGNKDFFYRLLDPILRPSNSSN